MIKTKLFVILAMAIPTFAQTTVKDAMVKHWKVSGEFTIAVAKAMPADKYNFRPSPEEMSFGQVMAHIGLANAGACATASGMTRPTMPAKIAEWSKNGKLEIEKDTAVQYLGASFDFCNQAVAAMTAEKMDAKAGPAARNMTGFEWLWSYFTHTAHHRGQAEVYLRVNGIKPPDYMF